MDPHIASTLGLTWRGRAETWLSETLSATSGAHWIRFGAVALCYFLLAKGGLGLASLHPSASPVWPPSGFALGALLLWGNSLWPAIALGAFVANATTFGSLATSAAIAVGNTLEAIVTAALIERWSGGIKTFETPLRIAIFTTFALAPGTIISATVGVGSLLVAGFAEPSRALNIWLTWWLGDVGGQILLTPAMVLCARRQLNAPQLRRVALLLGATIFVGVVAFSPIIPEVSIRGLLAFVAVAPLLWSALRHTQCDTAIAALVLSAFAIAGTLSDGGPFARSDLNDSFLLVLAFVIATAVPSLMLSADVALRRLSEEHHRAVIEEANDIVAILDLDFRFTSVNPAIERILGYLPEEVVGRPLRDFVPPEQLPMHREMLARKLEGQQSTQYEMQLLGKDGQSRFTLEVSSRLIRAPDGTPQSIHSISRNITERKEAEQRQLLLVRELQHRTGNLLAVVQSIAASTLSNSSNPQEALKALTGRLHALAQAQHLVTSGPRAGLPLRLLVERELSSFGARARISGDAVVIGPAFSQTFALVVHELATNACKYGALSRSGGTIDVDWRVEGTGNDARLHFSWRERGGPPPVEPVRAGLGTKLISAIGNARVRFAPDGAEYSLVLPLTEALQ
jgi:PAS domain S-box-containing protein